MEEADVWRIADTLIKRFGDDAVAVSSIQVRDLLVKGDEEGYCTWLRIMRAIVDFRSGLPSGQKMN